jgi:transposase-like protein
MKKVLADEVSEQADSATIDSEVVRVTFETWAREAVRDAFLDLAADEVERLCGRRHHPDRASPVERAGSAQGRILFGTEAMPVLRPRVRQRGRGAVSEVSLHCYQSARRGEGLREAVIRATQAGVSSRAQSVLHPETPRCGRSSISREWSLAASRRVEDLRGRDLSQEQFLALLMDGIVLGEGVTVVVAVGITEDGRKMVLDFQPGATENTEVCTELLRRIVDRGFQPCRERLLAVLDGAPALLAAVLACFTRPVVQRCLVHKERNVLAKLAWKWHGEARRLFKALRVTQGLDDARAAIKRLRTFLAAHSAQAVASLDEAGEEQLLAVHALGLPNTLHVSLLSTNCIENPFRNVRAKLRRVCRWRSNTPMAERWMADALLQAEAGFHRIKGHHELARLAEALGPARQPGADAHRPDSPPPSDELLTAHSREAGNRAAAATKSSVLLVNKEAVTV